MINLVCCDPITKIWKANVLFKYDYKLWKIENMVVPVGTTGVNGLSQSPNHNPVRTVPFSPYPQVLTKSQSIFIKEFSVTQRPPTPPGG